MFNLEKIDWEGLSIDAGLIALKIVGVIVAFILIRKIGYKIIDRTYDRILSRKEITEGRTLTLHKLTENIFSYALIFIVAATLFSILGIPVASLIAGAGIVGLAIGFGAQGLVSDVVTGFFLLLERQIDVSDYVTIGNFDGVVEAVGLRTTQLRGLDGTLHYIPNREILTVSNHSRGNMRALVDISVSYNDDLDKVTDVMKEVCDRMASANDKIVEGPNVLGVQAFGASDVVIRVIAKTVNGEQFEVERQLRKEFKEAFEQHGIEIPLPHQVFVHKDGGGKEKSLG
ncbi:mechanosensitive ion channel family protein [Robertmurraya kyonggiensis]|uniref:Mechanosensitive ion channel family protein n=1 Tax=Robertmurraya kyonggiensis TaxID=1037680 RepID=A0A4U1DB01_9BACI|nr:mechanosensitive ion channel family protein [Robertmurraya kyonggiensis]TKC19213.1 mechanosensitive ion channel family protein [Robertmurraya kyonggiensis]